jgi:hypothetical protein
MFLFFKQWNELPTISEIGLKKAKKKKSPVVNKTLVSVYLEKKQLARFRESAAELGLTLSRYFIRFARRDRLGRNRELGGFYTSKCRTNRGTKETKRKWSQILRALHLV